MTAAAILRAAPVVPCAPWPRHVLTPGAWAALVAALPASPALDLRAMWADSQQIYTLFHDRISNDFIPASVQVDGASYLALSPPRPAAAWFERMIHDLWGHVAEGGTDLRPWLDHGKWDQHAPMSPRATPALAAPGPPEFLLTEGIGMHGADGDLVQVDAFGQQKFRRAGGGERWRGAR